MEDNVFKTSPTSAGVLMLVFCSVFMSTTHGQDLFYFNIKPENKDVVEGSETKLYCDVSDRRHIAFQWVQGGKPIVNTTRKYQEDSNLRIMRVLREMDEGPFQCIATNVTTGFSLQSQEALLNIQWINQTSSVILKRPKKSEIQVGSNITLRCQVAGNPSPDILWYNNRFRLFTSERYKILDGGARLKLIGVTAAENGIISCSSENMAGAVDSYNNFLLNVKAPNTPRLLEDEFTPFVLATKGKDVRLDCPFEGASRIYWFANYVKLTNSSRHQVFENGSLYFPKVRSSDGGSYRCEGISSNAPSQSFTVELALSGLDDITLTTFEPRLLPNYPIVIPVQERFEMKVFPPGGQPKPTYGWLDKNDRLVGTTGDIHVDGTNLVFEKPQQVDTGNYTFVMSNTAAVKKQKVSITVTVPPLIRRPPKSDRVDEDDEATFSCLVKGSDYPVTTVLWSKDGQMISLGSKRHRMDLKTGILVIPRVSSEDEGLYACVANTTGHPVKVSSAAQLKVNRKLKFNPIPESVHYLELNEPAEIPCKAEAPTRPEIHWIHVGQEGKKLPQHVFEDDQGTLHFKRVLRDDDDEDYICMATDRHSNVIKFTVTIKIVQKPKFRILPNNETKAFEGQPMFLHCVALGDPKPQVNWEKDGRYLGSSGAVPVVGENSRFTVFPNGTLLLPEVLMEDKGKYGCKANNSEGEINAEFNLRVTIPVDDDDGFDMGKTVIIAVCSAGAYLALVIGLSAYCSYKLLSQRKNGKQLINPKDMKKGGTEFNHHREQHELLMKDRDSGMQGRSDSDNRSHASGLSSHPSQSSTSAPPSSAAPPSSHMSSAMALARARAAGADKFQFPRQEIQTLGIIGKSQFGDVFLAKARGIRPIEPETLVMVKSLLVKGELVAAEFQQEMDMYGKLEHPNIVKLLGVCKETKPVFMITEYCDWGDLKQFLLATRSDNGRRQVTPRVPTLSNMQKTKMCQQVALAMEYLSSYKFVHKDLAARNILLTSRMDLKVCSLSLCCDVYAKEYYRDQSSQALIPLRWLPPEAVRDSEYSFSTDIWSYGIFLWEVFHLADLPYRLHSDEDVFDSLFNITAMSPQSSLRLDFAEHCPAQVGDIVQQCCVPSPSKRPTFSDLVVTLGHLLTKGDCV